MVVVVVVELITGENTLVTLVTVGVPASGTERVESKEGVGEEAASLQFGDTEAALIGYTDAAIGDTFSL